MLEEDPELFIRIEECVLSAPPRIGFEPVTRPSQASFAVAETIFARALERYVHHTDYYLAGYVMAERITFSYTDAQERSVGIARSIAQTSAERQVIELVAKQHAHDVSNCAVLY